MKKLKCPKCGEEIDHLLNVQNVYMSYCATLDKNGDIQYEQNKSWSANSDEDGYDCPECNETLFKSEFEATKFLKGLIKP